MVKESIMTYVEYKEAVKASVVELIRAQLDMSLTEGARANAHSELVGLLAGSAEQAWEMFNFS